MHAPHTMEGRRREFGGRAKQLDLLTPESQKDFWRRVQLFPTPPAAVRCMYEIISTLINVDRDWYDPCAGKGHTVVPLREAGRDVIASDLYDHGKGYDIADALDFESRFGGEESIMATNPPFTDDDYSTDQPTLAERIVRKAQETCDDVIVFGRLGFLGGSKRYALHHDNPLGNLKTFMLHTDRMNICLGHYNPKGSCATDYAWYHYQRGYQGMYMPIPIEPGALARNFKPEDVKI
jgi:hypothetical protein